MQRLLRAGNVYFDANKPWTLKPKPGDDPAGASPPPLPTKKRSLLLIASSHLPLPPSPLPPHFPPSSSRLPFADPAAQARAARLAVVLYHCCELVRCASILLAPVLPRATATTLSAIGYTPQTGGGDISPQAARFGWAPASAAPCAVGFAAPPASKVSPGDLELHPSAPAATAAASAAGKPGHGGKVAATPKGSKAGKGKKGAPTAETK